MSGGVGERVSGACARACVCSCVACVACVACVNVLMAPNTACVRSLFVVAAITACTANRQMHYPSSARRPAEARRVGRPQRERLTTSTTTTRRRRMRACSVDGLTRQGTPGNAHLLLVVVVVVVVVAAAAVVVVLPPALLLQGACTTTARGCMRETKKTTKTRVGLSPPKFDALALRHPPHDGWIGRHYSFKALPSRYYCCDSPRSTLSHGRQPDTMAHVLHIMLPGVKAAGRVVHGRQQGVGVGVGVGVGRQTPGRQAGRQSGRQSGRQFSLRVSR